MITHLTARSILEYPDRLPAFLDEMERVPSADLDALAPMVFDVIAMKDRSLSLITLGRIIALRPDWLNKPEGLGFQVTPLIRAVKSGCLATVNLLLDAGAQVHAADLRSQNALDYATRLSFNTPKLTRICEALLEKGALAQQQKDLALYSAADSGNLAAVRVLLAHGADFIKGSQRETAMAAACFVSKPGGSALELVRAMLQTSRGREVIDWGWDLPSKRCGAPIHCAARCGNLEVLSLLVEAGAHVNPTPEHPQTNQPTPLMRAAMGASIEAVSFLLAASADASLSDVMGHNALHFLASHQNHEMGTGKSETLLIKVAEVLLAAGADPFAEDHNGLTPEDTALENENARLAAHLAAITSARSLSSGTPDPDGGPHTTPRLRL